MEIVWVSATLAFVALILLLIGVFILITRNKKQIKYEITKDMTYTQSIYYQFLKWLPYTFMLSALVVLILLIKILIG